MSREMTNGQYYFEKLEDRRWMRGSANKYCYVSPETRALMVTSSGAALLPGTYQWQRVEELVATHYFDLPLYNPTDFEITPDREKSRFDRFFEMCIKAKLFCELPKYRRVYDALGISFKPADRINVKTETEYSDDTTVTDNFGNSNTATETPTGTESVKHVTDSGAKGTGADGVGSGDISSATGSQTAFDSGSFADNGKTVNTVITPTRTVDTETTSFTQRSTTTATIVSGQNQNVSDKDGESETTRSGWDNYDIEGSVKANLELAQTTLEKMIAEDIVAACTVGVFDVGHRHANIPDFIMTEILWGEYDVELWNSLDVSWKGASYHETYD